MKQNSLTKIIQKCRKASPIVASLSTQKKNQILKAMAQALRKNQNHILKANKKDLALADQKGLSSAMRDRLLLNEERIDEMAKGLEEVIRLPDPIGDVVKKWKRPNGLMVSKVRISLGVIGVIYESRPNVTVDAAGLCFKSGNCIVLRGGSEAFYSNQVLTQVLHKALKKHGVSESVVTFIPSTDRKLLVDMLQLSSLIDVVIPRGGSELMKFMNEHSKIPVIKHDKGVCNLYVDSKAHLERSLKVIDNSKTHRPGVCNALENLFVHQAVAKKLLPKLAALMKIKNVELRGDAQARSLVPGMKKATRIDWETEYLDLILSVKVVHNIDEAIHCIRQYGSLHTEAIMTESAKQADKFIRELDSSCIMVNASTRFNDGGQLGLGAEIGISTTKIHAFGPMGLEELTSTKYVVRGSGQVRH